jgi:hypothetical protein
MREDPCRPGDGDRQRLCPIECQRFRYQLAQHYDYAQVHHDGERDHEPEPLRDRAPEQVDDKWLADRTDEDPDRRDPDLHRGNDAHGLVHQL